MLAEIINVYKKTTIMTKVKTIGILTQVDNKAFITAGLLTAQVEIAMSSFDAIAQHEKSTQQSHAVGTTAQCHNIAFLLVKQVMGIDEIFDFLNHST